MKKYIVTTTINPPTKAVKLFDAMNDWELLVIGDKKTPNYTLRKGRYVSPQEQEAVDKKLSDAIGWNCIQRRNIGILMAYKEGADVIAVVDDDNIPLTGWGENLLLGKNVPVTYYETDLPAFDPVGATNYPQLWHRGYPLPLIAKRKYTKKRVAQIVPDIQADFWNGDPDIDALCRMEHAPHCTFDDSYFPIASTAIAPFNSQNTFFSRNVIKDYFLFPFIGRMDDIWASFYVQAKGYHVVYAKPSVYQERNTHNLINDMKNEYLGYEYNLEICERITKNPDILFEYIPEGAKRAFSLYQKHF